MKELEYVPDSIRNRKKRRDEVCSLYKKIRPRATSHTHTCKVVGKQLNCSYQWVARIVNTEGVAVIDKKNNDWVARIASTEDEQIAITRIE